MKYIQPHGVADSDAGYVNGNPALGIAGSIPPAAALEDPQREIVNAIIGAGLIPSDSDLTQLWAAIQRSQRFHYGADTGIANALSVPVIAPATTERPDGFAIAVKVAHACTGDGTTQVTIAVGGAAARPIVRPDGSNVRVGDLLADQIAILVLDGARYFMVSPNAASFSGGGGGGGGGPGLDGSDGAPGSQIYPVTTTPAGDLGINGDWAIVTSTESPLFCNLYRRESGAWSLKMNLRGASGADAPRPSAITLNVATTLATAHFDYEVKLSAAATFTTTLPTPVANGGVGRFHIYNASAVPMTLATPAGAFVGPRGSNAASQTLAAGQTLFAISDGANWVVAFTSGDIGVPDVFDYTITAGVSQWLSDDISGYRRVEVVIDGVKGSWGGTYANPGHDVICDFAESPTTNYDAVYGAPAPDICRLFAEVYNAGDLGITATPGYGGAAFALIKGLYSVNGDAGAARWALINENRLFSGPGDASGIIRTVGTRLRLRTLNASGNPWVASGTFAAGHIRLTCWK